MIRYLAIVLALPYFIWAAGCIYDLDIEGKKCNTSDHICPSGYECVEWEGEDVCRPKRDGGGNGGDEPACFGDVTECVGYEQIRTCSANNWVTQDCPEGEYCTNFDNEEKAACVSECTSHEECQSQGTSGNFYCDEINHCEPKGTCVDDTGKPDENRCSPDGSSVVVCNSATGWDDPVDDCDLDTQYCDRVKAQCRPFCDNDSGCNDWPEESCNPATGRCEPAFLCNLTDDCNGNAAPSWIQTRCESNVCECTGSVCVVRPVEQCTSANLLDLSCFTSSPNSPGTTPPTCNLEGRVVQFIFPTPINYNADVEVRAHATAEILKGVNTIPLQAASVTDDGGQSQYSLQGLPTNEYLVLEVRCKDGTSCGYHSMYTFGLYLRADECASGTVAFATPTIPESLWPLYATAGSHSITADTNKGVFLGRMRECSVETNKIEKGTGDVSMSREVVYYIPSIPPINLDDQSTLNTGFFGAANVLAIRGYASALVRDQGDLLSLRTYEIRVFENSASLVFFDKPKKTW